MSSTSKREWLRPILQPLKPIFREVLVISFFVNILALAVPVFTMQVYDRVVFHAGVPTLYGLGIGMILILAFDYILRQTRSRVMQTVSLRVDVEVGRLLFNKVMSLPLQALEAQPAAHWQSLFRDVDTVRNTLSGASAMLVADLPFAILFLGVIFVVAAPIIPVLLVIVPVFMFVAWRSGNVMAAANQEERQTSQSRDSMIAEMIAGRTTIKALALDGAMRPIWEDKHADNIQNAISRGGKTDGYSNFGGTLTMLTTISLTSVGAIAIINQSLTMGALIATNMLSGRLLGPLNQLVGQWRTFASFKQSVERLGALFDSESDRLESEVKLETPKGEFVMENVTFSYVPGGAPVVDNLSLSIPAGGVHALVGRNGCGKSTVLKLIQGLYHPSDGRVLIDGADMAQFTRAELATWIGYVPQECVLFAGTVRENIAHRHPDAEDDVIIKAATAAGVHRFIIDLPDGYASDIGEAGRRLSGGQRQRIAIARALLGDPPALLLDEPSSSLDRQAEQELRNTLSELSKERTVIVVTHSPILLGACDFLVAIDRGKVALAGPAKEILPRLLGGAAGKPPAKEEGDEKPPEKAAEPEKPAEVRAKPEKPAEVRAKPEPQAKAPTEPKPPAKEPAKPEKPADAAAAAAPSPADIVAAVTGSPVDAVASVTKAAADVVPISKSPGKAAVRSKSLGGVPARPGQPRKVPAGPKPPAAAPAKPQVPGGVPAKPRPLRRFPIKPKPPGGAPANAEPPAKPAAAASPGAAAQAAGRPAIEQPKRSGADVVALKSAAQPKSETPPPGKSDAQEERTESPLQGAGGVDQ